MEKSVAQKIDKFFGEHQTRKYKKGQVLILVGDELEHVYNLVSGRVKQYDVTYRGDEIILNVYKPPAFFPMSLAINGSVSPHIYEAETDIQVRQVPAKDAVTFIKQNPDVMFDLLSRLYRGTDGLLARMSHLMASSARSRLMYEILFSCQRYGDVTKDGGYEIAFSEGELGARAGLSRETVSREMRKLIRDGLVDFSRHKITVHDLKVFEEKLGKSS